MEICTHFRHLRRAEEAFIAEAVCPSMGNDSLNVQIGVSYWWDDIDEE